MPVDQKHYEDDGGDDDPLIQLEQPVGSSHRIAPSDANAEGVSERPAKGTRSGVCTDCSSTITCLNVSDMHAFN